jgi:hypothetical protein
LEQDRLENGEIVVSDEGTVQFKVNQQEDLTPTSVKPRRKNFRHLKTQMRLINGNAESKAENRGRAPSSSILYRTYAHKLEVCFHLEENLQAKLPNIENLEKVKINAEIKPPGDKHPRIWASDAQDDKPALDLHFSLQFKGCIMKNIPFMLQQAGRKLLKRRTVLLTGWTGDTEEGIAETSPLFHYPKTTRIRVRCIEAICWCAYMMVSSKSSASTSASRFISPR